MYYAMNKKRHAEKASTSTVGWVKDNINYKAIMFIIIKLELSLYSWYLKLMFR